VACPTHPAPPAQKHRFPRRRSKPTQGTASQNLVVPLAAGSHNVKLQAASPTGGHGLRARSDKPHLPVGGELAGEQRRDRPRVAAPNLIGRVESRPANGREDVCDAGFFSQ
jgi:hypothetical protein